jgi:FlaG/FlaF family flagellin (archaellin)
MIDRSSDRRGVSQAVATVFVVGIVIVLAATSSVYVSGVVGDATDEPPPQAAFGFLQNGNAVTIAHEGGDAVPASELAVAAGDARDPWRSLGGSGTVSAGSVAQLSVSGDETVGVIWSSPTSGRTAVIAETTVSAPTTAAFTGTTAAVRSTADDGSYLGFGDQRLGNAGDSSSGQFRVVPYATSGQLPVRDGGGSPVISTGYSPAPGTHPFSLTYDGSTFTFTAGGASVTTSGVAVGDDALTVQVKKADAAVTTASVSNLQVDGASVGSPDGVSVSAVDEKSLLLEGGGFADGVTLTGEFAFDNSGSVNTEGFVLRIDTA